MSGRIPHYIREAGTTKVPRLHCVLDVESVTEHRNGQWTQHWRLACAEHFTGHAQRGWTDPEPRDYDRPWELWADIHWRARDDQRLVVWCHNLAYDMRVSGALAHLPAMGYELEGIALDHAAGWARFTNDLATVLMVDLCSWLPAPLSKVGEDVGLHQLPRPDDGAPRSEHLARCRQDVRITCEAVRDILRYCEAADLGPWRPTGAGQSHSAWKRRHLTHRVLVHDQLAVLSAERAGAWTGRCEAWRHGELTAGPYTEYDLSLAYCQIAADSDLPAVLAGHVSATDAGALLDRHPDHAILAQVTVKADVECVPALHDEHILWPVGEFQTTLWDPELHLAVGNGCEVTVHDAWVYRRAPVLHSAASWIIGELNAGLQSSSAVQLRLLKHWARALVGRCALRYRTWETWGQAESDDVTLGLIHDWQSGDVSEMMQVGRQLRVLTEQRESDESLPQIPGWIMSECRRRLWSLMCTAGLDHILYVDTDSLIVDQLGAERLERRYHRDRRWPLHVKGHYDQVLIHGPRMLVVDGQRRMAGIPLQARLDENGRLAGEVFLSLRESLLRHQVDSVELLRRTYDPAGLDRRRTHNLDGSTAPITISTAS